MSEGQALPSPRFIRFFYFLPTIWERPIIFYGVFVWIVIHGRRITRGGVFAINGDVGHFNRVTCAGRNAVA